MLPENNTYGPWPLSGKFYFLHALALFERDVEGEIDIMEARGNGIDYPFQCVLPF